MIYLFKSLSKSVVLSKPKIGYVIKKTPGIVELLSRPPERDAINKLKPDWIPMDIKTTPKRQ